MRNWTSPQPFGRSRRSARLIRALGASISRTAPTLRRRQHALPTGSWHQQGKSVEVEVRSGVCFERRAAANFYLPHPQLAPWVEAFLCELSAFPRVMHDDWLHAWTGAGGAERRWHRRSPHAHLCTASGTVLDPSAGVAAIVGSVSVLTAQ